MISIIHYNMGNITSVYNALEYLKIPAAIIKRPEELEAATHIILPGVGAFAEGMRQLHKLGFVAALAEEVQQKRKPFLGICLGMQLLATIGHEDGDTPGLGLIAGEVIRLPYSNVHVPHVGWNTMSVTKENQLIKTNSDFYFVHSYVFSPADEAVVVGTCNYGGDFPAIINHENIFGTQFHPEKSQANGLEILRNFAAL